MLSTADSSVATAGKKSKKKKRKSEAATPEEGQAGPSPMDDPLYVEHDWRLRLKVRSLLCCTGCMQMALCSLGTCSGWLNCWNRITSLFLCCGPFFQVIRALHRCFLYDTGAGGAARFLDDARFQRLLPPLVAHLGLRPPTALAAALEADGAADSASALEASLQLGAGAEGVAEGAAGSAAAAGLDAFGRAVVACLAQLAVTAGSDAQWKPLNHQVTACALCGVCLPSVLVQQLQPPCCVKPNSLGHQLQHIHPPAHLQVLMMTRSLEPRTRLLALETVAQVRVWAGASLLAVMPSCHSCQGLPAPTCSQSPCPSCPMHTAGWAAVRGVPGPAA